MPVRLSPQTEQHIRALFPPISRPEAADLLLNQCGTSLPFLEKCDEFQLERVRFAALKLSAGEIPRLKKAIELAQNDWRDLLAAAGFAEDLKAHERWVPDPLNESTE
jgi:hypothetical protein